MSNVKSFIIALVAHIYRNVPNPGIVFRLEGDQSGIGVWRNYKQFLTDLENSHLIPAGITDINHPKVVEAMADLAGGSINGDIVFNKAGTKYIATEQSTAVVTGDAIAGDELTRANDGYRVEGFLHLKLAETTKMQNKIARATSEAYLGALGLDFGLTATQATPFNAADVVEKDESEGVESVGSILGKEEQPEEVIPPKETPAQKKKRLAKADKK